MKSLSDIRYDVEDAVRKQITQGQGSVWDELVDSSIGIDGAGCDGFLMDEVERYMETLLSKMSDGQMRKLWLDTGDGMMSVAQGFDRADRWEMIHDITLDVCQTVTAQICQEAKAILRKKRRKKNV